MNREPSKLSSFVWASLCFLVTLAVFMPPQAVAFLNWDDLDRIVGDGTIRGLDADHLYAMVTHFSISNYTPVEKISCAADYVLWGGDAFGFRFTNVLLHAANAALVFLLVLRLFALGGADPLRDSTRLAALLGAGVFALHPLRVESVAWISERRDVLSLFWLLLATLLYLRRFDPLAREDGRLSKLFPPAAPRWAGLRWLAGWKRRRLKPAVTGGTIGDTGAHGKDHPQTGDAPEGEVKRFFQKLQRIEWSGIGAWFCFVLSLLSKASGVTWPLVLWLLDGAALRRFDLDRGSRRAAWRCLAEKLVYLIPALIMGFIALVGQRDGGALMPLSHYPVSTRILHGSYGIVVYLLHWLAPWNLAPYYMPPFAMAKEIHTASILAVILVIILSGAALWQARRRPWLAAGWFAFLVMILPFSGAIQAGGAGFPDRYTYAAMIPMALGMGALVLKAPSVRWKASVVFLLVALLGVWTGETRSLIPHWNSSRTLWMWGIADAPWEYAPLNNLSGALINERQMALGRVMARDGVRSDPWAHGRINLAVAEAGLGRKDRALRILEAALKLDPWEGTIHADFVRLLPIKQQGKKVLHHSFAAVQCGPDPDRYLALAAVLQETGHAVLAKKYFQWAAREGSVRAYVVLGTFLDKEGKRKEAVVFLMDGYRKTRDIALLLQSARIVRHDPKLNAIEKKRHLKDIQSLIDLEN